MDLQALAVFAITLLSLIIKHMSIIFCSVIMGHRGFRVHHNKVTSEMS